MHSTRSLDVGSPVQRPPRRNRSSASLVARLFSKACLDVETGCWTFAGATSADGYGRFSLSGKNRLAHRVAYELVHGVVPANLTIDHLCGNRKCINPAHLEAVTHRENVG